MSGGALDTLAFVYARYGSDLTWIPHPQRNDFLITTCLGGFAHLREGDEHSEWWPGACRAISADSELTITGCGSTTMASTLIGRHHLTRTLEHWLGRTLDDPLQLKQVVTADFARYWADLARHVRGLFQWSPSAVAAVALEQYAGSLIVNLHRHNYSTALAKLPRASDAALREARHFIHEQGHLKISMIDVAQFAGCSLAALTRAFREVHGTTLTATLRDARMKATRNALAHASAPPLPEVAEELSFASAEGLSAWYQSYFGTDPEADRHSRE